MAEPTPESEAPPASEAPPDAAAGPVAEPAEALAAEAAKSAAAAVPAMESLPTATPLSAPQAADPIDLSHLPLHTRSLLKIQVAVTVTLAKQRRPISEITELGPGTIVKFEKTYDEPLELTVGELPIASGDVVKVGDKFGLRIGRIIRPHERFASVRGGE